MPDWLLPNIPPDIPAYVYYFCVGLAVLIVGISKAGFGGGTGILAVPLMAIAMGPEHMLGVMLPLLIACDLFSNLHYHGKRDWPRLKPLLLGAVLGVALGAAILVYLQTLPPAMLGRSMNGLIGSICLVVVLMQVYSLTGRTIPTLPKHPLSGGLVGFVAAAVSTLNHGAGPIVTVYFLQEKLPKSIHVGTILVYFVIINSVKVVPYLLLDNSEGLPYINATTLQDSIWFIPLIPMGTLLGAWLHNKVSERPFAIIMYVFTAIAAAFMLAKALKVV